MYLILFLGLFNSACGLYFSSVELTTESFVGTWVLNSSSQSLILNGEKNLKNTKLILSADNSFQLIDIPNCWADSLPKCSDRFSSYKGSWKLYKDTKGSYSLFLNMNNSNHIRGIEIFTGIWDGNVKLNFIAADADLGNIFVFTKQKT